MVNRDPQAPEQKTAQVRVKKNNIVFGAHGPGTVLFVTPSQARKLHSDGCVDIIGSSVPLRGPSENQMQEPEEKKSSDAPSSSPSIGSASSNEPGRGAPSQSSEEGAASLPSSSESSLTDKLSEGGESSPSTTPTSPAPPPTSSTSQTSSGGQNTSTGRGRNSNRSRA